MDKKPLCYKCRFGLFFEEGPLADNDQGYCQRYAPRPTDDERQVAYWPIVFADDWCGEFEEKESE